MAKTLEELIGSGTVAGPQGAQGVQGIQGAQGVQGSQGTGAQGFQGVQGSSGGGGGTVAASNTQVLYANATSAAIGSNNLTWNVATNLLSVNGNVRITNTNSLYFGGDQANTTANSQFTISYNVSTKSLDFTYIGA